MLLRMNGTRALAAPWREENTRSEWADATVGLDCPRWSACRRTPFPSLAVGKGTQSSAKSGEDRLAPPNVSVGLLAYLDPDALTRLFKLDVREAAPAAIRHANACGGAGNITALFIELLAL